MTYPSFHPETPKDEVYEKMIEFMKENSLDFVEEDFQKPWGGYFRISDENLAHFVDLFFTEFTNLKHSEQKLRPKLLIVAPKARLSWQYHFRRAEIWKVLVGPIKVMMSNSDEETTPHDHSTGELITLEQGQRHRLIGADNWGLVAEIWKHTDESNPSEESDIVRVQDDYGR